MTSLAYGIDIPYEVQLEHHAATSTTIMAILALQRSPGQPATRHLLTPGVYMVSLAYNGAAAATLQHVGGGTTNSVSVPAGSAGAPRTSAPIKISVQGTTEYLQVAAPSTGGSARATISVIPASTFDEMAESAQGVSVLSEISDLKTTKADKSEVADITTRLDTKADKVDVQNDLGDMVGLLAGWTADAIGGRNLIPETTAAPTEKELSDSIYYWDIVTGAKLEAGVEYTFSVIVDKLSDDDTTVGIELGVGTGRNYRADLNGVRQATVPYGERVTLTFIPPEDRIVEGGNEYLAWRIRNSQKAVTVAYREPKLERGRRATPWAPTPEEVAADIKASGIAEPLTNPLAPLDHSLALRLDTSVGTRIFAGDTMIHGDTGRRSVPEFSTSLDVSTSTAHGIHIRRVGDLVTLTASGKWISGNWITELIPSGFRPISSDYRSARGIASVGGNFYTFGNGATLLRLSFSGVTIDPGTSVSLESTWYTTDSWPTTLPGLPA